MRFAWDVHPFKRSKMKNYLVLLACCCAALAQAADPSSISFNGSLNAAKEKACLEKKLLILQFTAKWCQPCKVMDREVFADPAVRQFVDQHLVVYKVDVDEPANRRLRNEYQISALPTTVLLRASGSILSRVEQNFSPETFIDWVRQSGANFLNVDPVPAVAEETPVVEVVLPEMGEFDDLLAEPDAAAREVIADQRVEAQDISPLPAAGRGYSLQLAVFSQRVDAEELAVELVSRYNQEVRIAEEQRKGAASRFRVMLGHFDQSEEAGVFLDVLHRDGYSAELVPNPFAR